MSLDAVDLEVLRLVGTPCRTVGVPWMLVGALARDVHLVEIAGVPSGRATIDVDVAVAVESWAAFMGRAEQQCRWQWVAQFWRMPSL